MSDCNSCGHALPPGGGPCRECGHSTESGQAAAAGSARGGSTWDVVLEKLKTAAAPRYRVLHLLGSGGMAGVYLADEPRLGRRVVIKVLNPALLLDPQLVERFAQEARTIAQLSHANIVNVFDVAEADGLHFFVMSYVAGRSLSEVLADTPGPLPVPVVRAWLYQVADALAHAHRAGVVHRDVKPGNILLDLEGNALVGDFGIAKVSDEPGLTRTGFLVGTPAYMSPEQCLGARVDGASDQYSLGIVAYQMLTGRAPFSGPTLTVLQSHVHQPPRPIAELRHGCPPELLSAVERMLAKRPDDRWPSLSAAMAAIGATAPGVDDPVRLELRRLAARSRAVVLTSSPTTVKEGEKHHLRGHAADREGRPLDRHIFWHSDAPDIAWISERGELSALRPGRAHITAFSGQTMASTELVVEADPVVALTVAADLRELRQGQTVALTAAAQTQAGVEVPGRAVVWSSSDPDLAAVTADGILVAHRAGSVLVSAASGGCTATIELTILPHSPAAAATSYSLASDAAHGTAPAGATALVAGPATPGGGLANSQPSLPAQVSFGTPTPVPHGAISSGGPSAEASAALAAAHPLPDRVAASPGRWSRLALTGVAAGIALAVVAAVAIVVARSGGGASAEAESLATPGIAAVGTTGNPGADPAATASGDSPGLASADRGAEAPTSSASDLPAGGSGDVRPADPPAVSATAAVLPPQTGTGAAAGAGGAATSSQPGGPTSAANAVLLVQSGLPPGAVVMLTASDGRVHPLQGDSLSLPAGEYRFEAAAPGHETASGALSLAAGQRLPWSPGLRPLPPAVAAGSAGASPQPDPASQQRDMDAVRAAARGFVEDLAARRTEPVLALLPAEARSGWQTLLTERSVTNWLVTPGDIETPQLRGDRAAIRFEVELSYRSGGRNDRRPIRFDAELERTAPAAWRLISVRPAN